MGLFLTFADRSTFMFVTDVSASVLNACEVTRHILPISWMTDLVGLM